MKKDIHPEYHKVLFVDTATGTEWVTRSTMDADEKREIDGEQVPVVRLEVSSASHPAWTGGVREAARGGKVDEFRRRYGSRK